MDEIPVLDQLENNDPDKTIQNSDEDASNSTDSTATSDQACIKQYALHFSNF